MDIIVPQDTTPLKRCYRCTLTKPFTDFYRHKNRKGGVKAECKACTKELDANRKKPNDITKGMRAVGFNRLAYQQVWEQQKGKCAICGQLETGKNQWGVKKLAVDHDHATGQFRGLLCQSCNVKLGVLEDQAFFNAAMTYLRKHDKLPHEFFEGGRLL